jgi:hypothetical protein
MMITVTITHPNGQQQNVLLSGVPRVGESIRLRHVDLNSPALIVEHILWMESDGHDPEPRVIAMVRHRPPGTSNV